MKLQYRSGGELRATENKEGRTREFVISSETRDRYNTVLLLDKWELKNYNKNGIVGFEHDLPIYDWFFTGSANPDRVIGKGKAWKEDGFLIGSVDFEPEDINALAEKILRKVDNGTLKSTSVGFFETRAGSFGEGDEAEGGKRETYYYGGQELFEFSIVSIPANTDAVKRSLTKDAEFMSLLIQQKLPDYSVSDIRKMTFGDVLDILLEKKTITSGEALKKEMQLKRHKAKLRQRLISQHL